MPARKKTKKKTAEKPALGLCKTCPGLCCKYVALPIDTPETRAEFDDVRWYLAHKKVEVFVEDGDWYLQFYSQCRYLGQDHRCEIYETRPRICRGYKHDTCELHGDGYDYDAHFKSVEALEAYRDEHLKKRRKKKKRKS